MISQDFLEVKTLTLAIALQALRPYEHGTNQGWVLLRKQWVREAKGQGFTGEQWELTRRCLLSLLEAKYPFVTSVNTSVNTRH